MTTPDMQWFREARYGLFIHYGLYSMLGRGEWVLNKEQIPQDRYADLANRFTADKMDFDRLIGHARNTWGMRYAALTCKHHDGFCLYDSALTDHTAPKTACGRDLVAEFVEACRKHDMRISLYHSLNDWTTSPNAVDALEDPAGAHEAFLNHVFGQIREIMTNYGKIDTMWYDGWWPFGPTGWKAEELNAMVRELQPGILVNGRNGLAGDFGTPEGHVTSSTEPWEAAMTLNDNWGYHAGDNNWKSPKEVAEMLRKCAAGQGNLLLNVGPRGDGSVPEETYAVLDAVGDWLGRNEAAIFTGKRFEAALRERGDAKADWTHHGRFSADAGNFYLHLRCWPGSSLRLAGLRCTVTEVGDLATGERYPFQVDGDEIVVNGLPLTVDLTMPVVLRFRTSDEPDIYKCGGYRTPTVPHCVYDPVASDLLE